MFTALENPENAAAIWSAVAATFAAIAAFLSWLAQVKSLRHTFRPELVLTGWERQKQNARGDDVVTFIAIKNVGRDTARQVIVNAFAMADDRRPTYFMSTVSVPSLASGETVAVDAEIRLIWKNVAKQKSGGKLLQLQISAWCWDALSVRHITTMSVLVVEDLFAPVGASRLADGVYAGTLFTRSVPVWRLKLYRFLGRVPGFGKLFRDDA